MRSCGMERKVMDSNGNTHIALHAPNIINICIDHNTDGELSGRIYHCYDKEPWLFPNILKLIEMMETIFDGISYPQASTQTRTFVKKGQIEKRPFAKAVTTQELTGHRGELGTFLAHVQYRQGSSWQGEIEWVEKESRQQFISVLELLKLLNNALEG